jgi:hypothetical protein
MLGQQQRFRVARIGNADKHGNSAVDLGASAVDQLSADAVTERRPLAGRPENEQAVHATRYEILNEPFERGVVELVRPGQWRDQGRYDPTQGLG